MHWEHTIVERLGDIYYFRIESKVNTTILFCICFVSTGWTARELYDNCLHVRSHRFYDQTSSKHVRSAIDREMHLKINLSCSHVKI